MAWKDLLQKQDAWEERRTEQSGDAPRDRDSLIRLVCGQVGQSGGAPAEEAPVAAEERISYPDGYFRRSPVQPYRTSPDYLRRRVRKAVIAVIALCLLALLALALVKSGLINLK